MTDEMRGTSVPVGVALWSSNPEWVKFRAATEEESIKGLNLGAYPFLRIAGGKLDKWITENRLPYASIALRPFTDEWWRHVRKLFVHKVRISEPRPIDCKRPEDELELLYEAVVGPRIGGKEKRERIDGVLSKSLGAVAESLARGSVDGFGGRPVPVRRYVESVNSLLIVEGVNLAAAGAENDADALVSRLLRIREANGRHSNKSVVALVGYLASPAGLNGEAALVKWIEMKAEAKTYDLLSECQTFAEQVKQQVFALQSDERKGSAFVKPKPNTSS